MPEYKYSMEMDDADSAKVAKAQLYDVDASYKDLGAVCANIRGKTVDDAEALLEKAATGEWPIWYPKHNKKLGHRSEIGGKKGGYPKKSVKIVLQVLRNAKANADNRGLFGTLKVVSAAANKLATYPRVGPRGRWHRSDYETSRIEIILMETVVAKPEEAKAKKKRLDDHAAAKRKIREEMEKEERMEAEEPAEEMHEHEHAETPEDVEPKARQTGGMSQLEKHDLAEHKRKTEKKLTKDEKKVEKTIQHAESVKKE